MRTRCFPPLFRRLLPVLVFVFASFTRGLAEDEVSFSGTYRDEQVAIRLTRSEDLSRYTGTIELGNQKFPLKATQQEQRLSGSFESDGDDFAFSATLVGRILVFTTDGTTYRLRKQTTNPLARATTKPNPLAQARTNALAPGVAAAAAAPQPRTAVMRLRRHSILDDSAMIGGEASSLLIPADWQIEAAVTWRMHPSLPAYIALRASNSNRTEALEAFPSIPFVWVEGGIPLFGPGSNYMGNEVGQPIEDPLAYVQQVVLPRFRAHVKAPQLVSTEELPKVAEVLAELGRDSGAQQRFRAARVRFEYPEAGRMMQEDIYCVMALATVPSTKTTFWGADRNYAFKAEKGRLDARARLLQCMVNSFRPNLQWVNRYGQLVQLISQTPFDSTRPPAELGRLILRTTDEILDARRQMFERQQANQERVNATFSEYIRGLQEYRDPFESRTLRLPAGYAVVWAGPTGDYLLSDDPNYNPNTGGPGGWHRVEKDH